jgi:hypothetical protein
MVVPLRNPYLAYVTRSSSHQSVEGAKVKIANFWKLLMNAESKFDMCFLPVDYENLNRLRVLQSIANHLECNWDEEEVARVALDWRKVGTRGPSPEKEEWAKTHTIKGQVPTFLKEAEDWYYKKIEELGAL